MLALIIKSSLLKLYKILFQLIGMMPKNQKLIIFESYLGKQYSCNPRSIYEYLKDNHPEYKLIWSIDKSSQLKFKNYGIPYVRRLSVKWLMLVPTAKYWVMNSRMPSWINKPKNTIYLQTWHGTPLKKLASDIDEIHMPGTTTEKYIENFLKETKNWDYLISPNPYSTNIFHSAFKYPFEKMLESGYPRNDYLLNQDNFNNITKIKDKLSIPKDKKVILYAPTWRDDEYFKKGQYKFELKMDLDLLQKNLGDNYVILLRMHYLISNQLDISRYKGFVFDFSSYDDNRELYLISDLLITDYSSVFFDYLCLKRPIIFYTYDLQTYRDKLRGFYFDFENNAPGPLVMTTDKLLEEIKEFELAGFKPSHDLINFYNEFCLLEKGVSTERVVKSVFLKG